MAWERNGNTSPKLPTPLIPGAQHTFDRLTVGVCKLIARRPHGFRDGCYASYASHLDVKFGEKHLVPVVYF